MQKDPAVLFYTNDFLAGTFTMSNEQVGKYIRLLCIQHQKGKLTEKDMYNICITYDEDIWNKFELIDGYYINKRMQDESDKRKNYTNSRRNNRSKKDMNNICKTYDEHMENGNENENINEIIIEDERLKKIWSEWIKYKYTEHKDKYKSIKTEEVALKHLLEISKNNIDNAENIVKFSIANRWKGLFPINNKNNNNGKLESYKELHERITNSDWAREIDQQIHRS